MHTRIGRRVQATGLEGSFTLNYGYVVPLTFFKSRGAVLQTLCIIPIHSVGEVLWTTLTTWMAFKLAQSFLHPWHHGDDSRTTSHSPTAGSRAGTGSVVNQLEYLPYGPHGLPPPPKLTPEIPSVQPLTPEEEAAKAFELYDFNAIQVRFHTSAAFDVVG